MIKNNILLLFDVDNNWYHIHNHGKPRLTVVNHVPMTSILSDENLFNHQTIVTKNNRDKTDQKP